MVPYIIIGIIVILAVYVFLTYNSFIKASNFVKEAFSTMDVYMKKRWDLIPNLVQTVKGYAKHEADTFKKITELRSDSYDSMTSDKKIAANKELAQGIAKIMAIAENYPELKASQGFMQLSSELSKIENEIANSRKYYNATIRNFNNKVQMFPSNIIARMFNFNSVDMFEAAEEEKINVKVEF